MRSNDVTPRPSGSQSMGSDPLVRHGTAGQVYKNKLIILYVVKIIIKNQLRENIVLG